MAIVLALLTAFFFGVSDFCGGMAAKRATVLQVVAGSHLIGAVGATTAALLVAERFDRGDVALGMAGGLFGVVGVALLYRRLAVGPMSVVAPLTAITAAVVPTGWGIVDGERLSALGWTGVGLALVAVALVSMVSGDRAAAEAPVTPAVVGESLLAGVGFGAMFIFLDATEASSGPWPVAGARILTMSVLLMVLAVASHRGGGGGAGAGAGPMVPVDRRAWWLIAAVGVFDTGSNTIFLYAANRGQLSVVSVLSALYPVSTVILARVVLGERMTRLQGWGFVAAMVATELLVLG